MALALNPAHARLSPSLSVSVSPQESTTISRRPAAMAAADDLLVAAELSFFPGTGDRLPPPRPRPHPGAQGFDRERFHDRFSSPGPDWKRTRICTTRAQNLLTSQCCFY